MKGRLTSPCIYQYRDYRTYLKDFEEFKRSTSSGFSLRQFSKRSGLQSPSYFSLVSQGKRNLGQKTVRKFVTGLGLKAKEGLYFETLVNFNQTDNPDEKVYYLDRLDGMVPKKIQKRDSRICDSLFRDWRYPFLLETIRRSDFDGSQEKLLEFTKSYFTDRELKRALSDLESMEIVSLEPSISAIETRISSQDEVEELRVRDYHRKMLDFAKEKIDMPLDQRDFRSTAIRTTPEGFKKMKAKIKDFFLEAQDTFLEDENSSEVVHLSLQMIKYPE